ncbi:hypothetical protein KC19_8G106000 [Ceratodon purpureus]|uniref:NADP-dependent oxidoreductase domain-containing protein n=1 Tax=Ceratodon purpureus TaxID=3225 RepID=A0A8T0H2Q1_CERPU|nr:hypothetical protein KC19_8G106000 [Ceratodon purpureus]
MRLMSSCTITSLDFHLTPNTYIFTPQFATQSSAESSPEAFTMAMPYTTLSSGLQVSKLCLGTMTYGEQNSFEDACEQLNVAREEGVNFFDAAEMYPVPQRAETQGRTEEYVGRWLRQSQVPRDRVVLATKATGPSGQMTWIRGGPSSLDGRNIREAIDGSLTRLGTDYIDLYQLHWPDRYVPMFGDTDYDPSCCYSSVCIEEQLEALSIAVKEGKIRNVGVSNETAFGLMEFCRLADQNSSLPRISTIQNAYSLLCRTFDMTLAECCHHQRVGLLAYSPLAMGLLSGKYLSDDGGSSSYRLNKYRGRYAEAECRYSTAKPNVLPAIRAYVKIAQRHNLSPVALAIGFVLRHPLLTSVVMGATRMWQLREILDASRVDLSEEILTEIDVVHELYPNPTP